MKCDQCLRRIDEYTVSNAAKGVEVTDSLKCGSESDHRSRPILLSIHYFDTVLLVQLAR